MTTMMPKNKQKPKEVKLVKTLSVSDIAKSLEGKNPSQTKKILSKAFAVATKPIASVIAHGTNTVIAPPLRVASATDQRREMMDAFKRRKPIYHEDLNEHGLQGKPPQRAVSETKSGLGVEQKLPTSVDLRAPPVHYFGATPKPHTGVMKSGKSGNSMSWTAEERICAQAIQTTTNTAGTVLIKLIGNPTVINAPRANWAAQAFDNYEFESVEIRWSGALGTSVSGKIGAAYDADSTDLPGQGEAAVSKLASHPGYDTTHVFTDKTWRMPANCKRACWTKYSTTDDSDIRLTDQFNFWALLSVPVSGVTVPTSTQAPLVLGEWYIKYKIRFFNQTMENVILGNSEFTYNTDSSVAGGGNTSSNLGSTVVSNYATLGFRSYPTEAPSPTTDFKNSMDYITTGPLSSQVSFDYQIAGAVHTGFVPSQGQWSAAFPSIPMRYNVVLAAIPSAITSSTALVYFYNVDDPSQWARVQIVAGAVTITANNVQSNTVQVDYGAHQTGGAQIHAETAVYVDPSGFKTSPSRIGVIPGIFDSQPYTVLWAGSTVYNEIFASALSADQQAYWGMPQYNMQGAPLQATRVVKPTRNSELQRRRFGDALAQIENKSEIKVEGKSEVKEGMSLTDPTEPKTKEASEVLNLEGAKAVFKDGAWLVLKSPAAKS